MVTFWMQLSSTVIFLPHCPVLQHITKKKILATFNYVFRKLLENLKDPKSEMAIVSTPGFCKRIKKFLIKNNHPLTHTYTQTHTQSHIYKHIYVHKHTYTYIQNTHTYTNIHTNTQK